MENFKYAAKYAIEKNAICNPILETDASFHAASSEDPTDVKNTLPSEARLDTSIRRDLLNPTTA